MPVAALFKRKDVPFRISAEMYLQKREIKHTKNQPDYTMESAVRGVTIA